MSSSRYGYFGSDVSSSGTGFVSADESYVARKEAEAKLSSSQSIVNAVTSSADTDTNAAATTAALSGSHSARDPRSVVLTERIGAYFPSRTSLYTVALLGKCRLSHHILITLLIVPCLFSFIYTILFTVTLLLLTLSFPFSPSFFLILVSHLSPNNASDWLAARSRSTEFTSAEVSTHHHWF